MDSLKGTLTPMKVLNGTLNGGIAYGTFNYNELENKPSVNGTELIGNVNIPIPTKTSDLSNDSGFITDADVPTKTSELSNDSGFITSADIPTKTSELTNDSGFITSEDIPNIPTNTSQLNNDSGFLTMNTTPVRSVNSQTGDVNLFIPNATSQLNNDAGFLNESSQKITDIDLDIDTLQNDINTLDDNIINLQSDVSTLQGDIDKKTNKTTINTYNLSSSTPIIISPVGAYHIFLIIGFVQGIGIINLIAKIVNSSTSVIDFVTGNAFSNNNLTFAYNPTNRAFVIQTPQAGASVLTIMRGGAN